MLKNRSDEVGAAIKNKINQGVVKREDLFIVSKLWNIFHQPDDVQRALDQSLKELDLGPFSKRPRSISLAPKYVAQRSKLKL